MSADHDAVVAALRGHDRFVVVTHENPDGDALGSMLATTLGLRALGKDASMYLTGTAPLPAEYAFLELDGLSRTLPDDLGDGVLIDDRASSTAEIVRDILRVLDVPLTPEIAQALYVGLVTDTGRFQYSNTTPKALELAAELVAAGADVQGVFQHVYETVQFAKLKLLARALERAQLYEGGGLVVSYLLKEDFGEVGAEEPYSEGIIDHLRSVEGSEMVALIREPPRSDGPARRISLRSSHDEVDVSAIARASGGGGHRQAAGFSSEASIDEIVDFLRRQYVQATHAT